LVHWRRFSQTAEAGACHVGTIVKGGIQIYETEEHRIMKRFSRRGAMFVSLGALLAVPMQAGAQQTLPSLQDLYSVPTAAEALADTYGQAIIAEFARLMSAHIDTDCARTRAIGTRELNQRAEEILLRYGDKVQKMLYPTVSDVAFEEELAKLAGPDAVQELRNFANHPGVKKIRMLGAPVRNDELVDEIANALDRYIRRARLSLGRDLSPIGSGNQALLELWENRLAPLDDFTGSVEREDWFRRFNALIQQYSAAYDAVATSSGHTEPAYAAFAGVEGDFRSGCILLKAH
jgi:hypothetical protein